MNERDDHPRLCPTPMWCVVVDGARWLALGIWSSEAAAQARANRYLAQRQWTPALDVTVQPIWVSVHVRRRRANTEPARPGREEANAG